MTRSLFCAAITVAGILACDRAPLGGGSPQKGDYSSIAIVERLPDYIAIAGLPADDIKRLRSARIQADAWQRLLRVYMDGSDSTAAIAGRYTLRDDMIEFRPLYPFDGGRKYTARFDPSAPPLNASAQSRSFSLAPAANEVTAEPVSIARILPSGDEWLENQLRFYVEFTAPMSRSSGLPHVKLVDAKGREVTQAFLPIETDFWNHDATRYTFFFDPGRVKRGILPNEQLGPPLMQGQEYSLVVDSLWEDAYGRPLAKSFRRSFRVGAPVHEQIAIAAWKIQSPPRATRQPLVITFPRRLDQGLLLRSLGIETSRSVAVAGEGSVEQGEMSWHFTPERDWRPGEYRVVILSILEDGAGNRIDRAFEVDRFTQVDSVSTLERYTLTFVVK